MQEYVQHRLRRAENAAALMRDLDNGGYIFVCGATAMGNDVHEALLEILQSTKGAFSDFLYSSLCSHFVVEPGLSSEESIVFVKTLRDSGRYVQELWSA